MEMQMTFYWGYDATILFSWWQSTTALEFYLSCLTIFFLCLGSSKLKAICHDIRAGPSRKPWLAWVPHSPTAASCAEPSGTTAEGGSNGLHASSQSPPAAEQGRWMGGPPLLSGGAPQSLYHMDATVWAQLSAHPVHGTQPDLAGSRPKIQRAKPVVVWLLMFISVMIDWAMMLVCMTYNGGLFLAVVGGVSTGQLLLQHHSDKSGDCCSASTHG
ncbi:uncharacterized protein LOC34618635 [Cyclospora cayetanensis]|uniref:Copper transport protein n=2 Tax=Cyclospora cayetanensis TaxID=88456 RepID=A0A1D3D5C6_9EIME|nr:uncharacterized protein LOC34618635 [Cyclospora cayetanensis]OEH78651.1 hypothetical protein cyc_01666 [Cyclospora cayetanensis]